MEEKRAVIDQIREFNRFYTVLLGLLDRNYLDSGYSVTETRLLFELGQGREVSANRLAEKLGLDKSYISRLIRGFEQKGLVVRQTSPEDRRAFLLRLTPRGQTVVEQLVGITDRKIYELIEPLDGEACEGVCAAMQTIIRQFRSGAQRQEEL